MSASSSALDCGVDVTNNPGANAILARFTEVTEGACIYGCYLSILYANSIQKYAGMQEAAASIGASIANFMSRAILNPSLLGGLDEAVVSQINQMVEMQVSAITDITSTLSDTYKNTKISDIIFSIAKTTVARYAKQILMAAVQHMVEEMKEEIDNRATLLGIVRARLADLQMALSDAAQYDWWDKFIEAVTAADIQLRDADFTLSRAYDSAREGNWRTEDLERAQWLMTVAWQRLASAGEIEELIDEMGSDFRGVPYLPFDPAFLPVKATALWDAMSNISSAIKDITEANSCLQKTTLRLQEVRAYILATYSVLQWLDSQSGLNVSLDILMNDVVIANVVQAIRSTRSDMTRVVSEHNKLVAPLSLETWKGTIKQQIYYLKNFGLLPTPWGMEAYGEEQAAMSSLEYLLFKHDPGDGVLSLEECDFSSTYVTDIIASIIRSAGDIVSLISNKPGWDANILRATSRIVELETKDGRARDTLNAFTGHDSDKYDYVLNMLNTAGMTGAAMMIERGQVKTILQSMVFATVNAGSALACLSSMFGDREGMDPSKLNFIERMFDAQFAEARSAVRSLDSLPSLQLQTLGVLRLQLQDALNEMTALANLAESGC